MRQSIRKRIAPLVEGRSRRAVLETALYALGAGALFYLVDVLSMRWQGLALP